MKEQANNGLPDGWPQADQVTSELRGLLNPAATSVSAWTSPRDRSVVVQFGGEVAYEHKEPLRRFLSTLISDHGAITLDLSKITFMDTSFISTLIVVNKLARDHGVQLRLKLGAPDSHIRGIFTITGLNQAFVLADGQDA